MPQRALLFSSDPETSRRLAQAFRELEFSVDHCPEIFAAVERITSHRFEVVVADWDDGVEAMFLIKTARELRLNFDAFRIVAARPEATTAALNAGAQMVLAKPAQPGHTKYALLTSDDFVQRLKGWVPEIAAGKLMAAPPKTSLPAARQPQSARPPFLETLPQPVPPVPAVISAAVQPVAEEVIDIDEDGAMNFRVANLDSANLPSRMAVQFDPSPTTAKPKMRAFLWASLVATGLSTGYFFASAFRAQASSPSGPSTSLASLSAGAATAPAPPLHKARLVIKATPDADNRTPEPVAAAEAILPEPEPEPVSEPVEEAVVVPPASIRPSIPASLSVPMQSEIGAHTSAPKPSSSLMSGVEPVTLAEDLAEKSLLQRVIPEYPAQALQSRLQGAVLLQAWIRKDGTVSDLKVINGPLVLCEAAYSAVKQWRYKPFQLNGQSVEAKTYVTVNFRLP